MRNLCEVFPFLPWCTGGGAGEKGGKTRAPSKQPNPDGPRGGSGHTGPSAGSDEPGCPPLPALPSNISKDQVQKNITTAQDLYNGLLATDPEDALPALFGFFVGKFAPGGDWDYKKNYPSGTQDQSSARIFGNFDFGAVLQSFDFSYTFTQSAAGVAQIAICVTGGACGTGIPGLAYPFGDQVTDAVDIKKGFDYEAAERTGCGGRK
jgi:hypothetical protein